MSTDHLLPVDEPPMDEPPIEVTRTRPEPRDVSARDEDDTPAIVGAAIASLALVWVVYEQLLALSGKVGFVLSWYVTFLALYAALTAIVRPGPAVPDRLVRVLFWSGAVVVGGALATTIAYTFFRAWPALVHVNFYTKDMAGVGPQDPLTQGGVLHAIAGTLIEISIAIVISLPLGVATAVYMTEVEGGTHGG
jgi:phosphate transport system permease protein